MEKSVTHFKGFIFEKIITQTRSFMNRCITSVQVNLQHIPFEWVQLQVCVHIGLSGEDLRLKNTPEATANLWLIEATAGAQKPSQAPPPTSVPEHLGWKSRLEPGNEPLAAGFPYSCLYTSGAHQLPILSHLRTWQELNNGYHHRSHPSPDCQQGIYRSVAEAIYLQLKM